jgi:hypothetical protein
MDLDRVIGGAYSKEDGKDMKPKGKARLGGQKKLGRTQMKKLGKTQDLPDAPPMETKVEEKPEGGRLGGRLGGRTQMKKLGKTQDLPEGEGGRVLGGRVLGGRVLGGILGGMKADKLSMLRDLAKKTDKELEGSGFYSAIGRGLMKRMRPLLGKEMEGSGAMMSCGSGAVIGGAVIGGAVIGGAVIGGAVIGGQEASAELVSGMDGGAKPPQKKKRTMSDKMKKRSEMIKSLMKGKGMTLAQASKHIKENKLM